MHRFHQNRILKTMDEKDGRRQTSMFCEAKITAVMGEYYVCGEWERCLGFRAELEDYSPLRILSEVPPNFRCMSKKLR